MPENTTSTSTEETTESPLTEMETASLIEACTIDPTLLDTLREEYGVTITLDGKLVEVKESGKFRAAFREGVIEGKEKGSTVASTIARGAGKVGQAVTYGLLDAPVEGAKKAKARYAGGHARRVEEARERKIARKVNRAAKKVAKAAAKAAEEAAEQTANAINEQA